MSDDTSLYIHTLVGTRFDVAKTPMTSRKLVSSNTVRRTYLSGWNRTLRFRGLRTHRSAESDRNAHPDPGRGQGQRALVARLRP